MSRLIRTVSSRLSPLPGSKTIFRHRPLSTTTRTPSMVRDVSAMGVASTTLRFPGRLGAMAAFCSALDSMP